MSYIVDNAIILAAGTASRFAPLSYETHKALVKVKGEVLIERQIRQLQEAGIHEIYVVVGYKKEQFKYLQEKFGVKIVENNQYLTRNSHSSIYAVKEHLGNSYICASDNYFEINPFKMEVEDSYYGAVYAEGKTNEWCLTRDEHGDINHIVIGGEDSWYIFGEAFWSKPFSQLYVKYLEEVYDEPETRNKYWEDIYMAHMDEMKMKVLEYPEGIIFEFDSLDELRAFDKSYVNDTKSQILKYIAAELCCEEKDIVGITAFKIENNAAAGFSFTVNGTTYEYYYESRKLSARI